MPVAGGSGAIVFERRSLSGRAPTCGWASRTTWRSRSSTCALTPRQPARAPNAFEIALQAVPPDLGALPGLDDPEPLRRSGRLVPDQGMTWHHYRGADDMSGNLVIGKGHEPKVEWSPDETPVEF
jgi:hypothetical protein